MKKFLAVVIFLLIGIVAKAQYRGLWFEGSQYYKLGDSTITVWGSDTLTNPVMVRDIIEWYFTHVKPDTSQYADTALFSLDAAIAAYADSARVSDTAYYSLGTMYSDTSDWAYDVQPQFNTITVAKSGGDYTSVSAAIASITDNTSVNRYTILVYPGWYEIEGNPIANKDYVTIQAAGVRSVVLYPENNNQDLFTGGYFSHFIGIVFDGVVGSENYAINNNTNGSVFLRDCVFRNCDNGLLADHPTSNLDLVNTIFNTPTSNTNVGIRIKQGTLEIDNLTVRQAATIDTLISITGVNSVADLHNINSIAPNLGTAFYFGDHTLVVGTSLNIGYAENAIIISGDSVDVRFDACKFLALTNYGFHILNDGTNPYLSLFATTILECENYNFSCENPTATIVGNGFTDLDKSYVVPGTKFFAYLLDTKEDDEGLNIIGELHVGVPGRGGETALGEGDSYNRNCLVYEYDANSTTYTNVTDSIYLMDGYCAEFPSTVVNSAIYIASRVLDTAVHHGIKVVNESPLILDGGEIVIEYWDGSTWTEFNGMSSDADPPFAPHAKAYFEQSDDTHIRYDIELNDGSWLPSDPMGTGTNHKWVRFRIASTITTSCRIDLIKLHSSRIEVNADGYTENFGLGRSTQTLGLNIGSGAPITGSMQSRSVYVDQNLGVGFLNNRFTTSTDRLGFSISLPDNLDTSSPVNLVWSGYAAAATNVQWTVAYYILSPGDPLYVANPAASGLAQTVQTVTRTATIGINEVFSVKLDLSLAVPSRIDGYGDQLWLTIQPSTIPTTFSLTNIAAEYWSFGQGGHY